MEFANCEQYVLAELNRVECENGLLRQRVEELEERSEPGPITAKVVEFGKRALFLRCTRAYTMPAVMGGRLLPFDEWCRRCVLGHVVDFCDVDDFITYFEPEFEDAYREASLPAGDAR